MHENTLSLGPLWPSFFFPALFFIHFFYNYWRWKEKTGWRNRCCLVPQKITEKWKEMPWHETTSRWGRHIFNEEKTVASRRPHQRVPAYWFSRRYILFSWFSLLRRLNLFLAVFFSFFFYFYLTARKNMPAATVFCISRMGPIRRDFIDRLRAPSLLQLKDGLMSGRKNSLSAVEPIY